MKATLMLNTASSVWFISANGVFSCGRVLGGLMIETRLLMVAAGGVVFAAAWVAVGLEGGGYSGFCDSFIDRKCNNAKAANKHRIRKIVAGIDEVLGFPAIVEPVMWLGLGIGPMDLAGGFGDGWGGGE